MKLFTSLPLALFACHALAQCQKGTFNKSTSEDGLDIRDECSLGPNSLYTCTDNGKTVMTVAHSKVAQEAFTFKAFDVDATVYIACDNGKKEFFSCRVGSSAMILFWDCDGAVASIYNVHEK
ncbi:uncharacterized protein CPUR_07812 [Claviceps purpurea 20.1]|uniref:Cyanovirin-N domain-containing protein n=1 Tax=Claviceps purpurea (strain 20.1) TaxID=1111077 RepID=M1WI54_CLAP2|nr:hypothetical protein E4U12_003924 [Claviceps purpurea]KAG6260027.1 hypothetical protein E4U49_005353 [Claviceps purpurea]KAG6264772.1 hypothetical protein E4U47_006746 [Claviceps purpurea]CCE33884.1 uncharacterized protein CPUR_07812 [Claviceps purpurea 20.1]